MSDHLKPGDIILDAPRVDLHAECVMSACAARDKAIADRLEIAKSHGKCLAVSPMESDDRARPDASSPFVIDMRWRFMLVNRDGPHPHGWTVFDPEVSLDARRRSL